MRGARGVVPTPPASDAPAVGRGAVEAAVHAELAGAKQTASAVGQLALAMAAKVDAGRDTGAALAALTRELRATLEVAFSSGDRADDRVDELRKRREAMARGA